ncbi:MAG: hypothetical protein EX285_08520 [Thaumarchaeota archaeon]|nr:hypothetical protein [Nitrososphaerota archaeon]
MEKAYETNIDTMSDEHMNFKNKHVQFSKDFYAHNRKAVINYYINDCKLTLELYNLWTTLFHDVTGFYPSRWLSLDYLAEKYLIAQNVEIPFFKSIPYKIQDLAYRSYYAGRFEMLKRGFIGEGYLFDINSAYHYTMPLIPDITDGEWINDTTIYPKAEIGFFKI